MDDSMSLESSDAAELSGSYVDPNPLPSAQPSAASTGMDTELYRVLSKALEELGMEWSPPEEPTRSRSESDSSRGTVRPLDNELHHSSRRSTMRSPSLGLSLTLPTFVPRLHPPSRLSTVLMKRGTRNCLSWMSQWPCISACPRPPAGRQRPPTRPSHVGRLQLLPEKPIRLLDHRPWRFIPWGS